MTDKNGNAFDVGCELLQRSRAYLIEILAQQQVFRLIPTECQLRRDQQARTGMPCLCRILPDFCGVAADVADGTVDLRDRDFHKLTAGPLLNCVV